jgi:hypothetical protein
MNLEIHKLKSELDDTNFTKKEADSQSLASTVATDINASVINLLLEIQSQ